jgi:serine/threonine-protein kinase
MRPVRALLLGDRYRLVRQVAVGGMGEVWVADDSALGREVAVKVLREEYTGQEDFLKRLRTEARNSAALSHPNIAQMYDYGEQEGTGYLVMELVLGGPLADLLEREPVLSPRRLLPILAQTARGLHHAHQAGVVHRDVKPGNILLEHADRTAAAGPVVKITDFGVSLAANQAAMTATGMVMGTAQYLSPEQAVGKLATPLSDIYALGVVAYEATAGKRPFTGATPVDIAIAHVNNPVPPLPSTVHPELAGLITQLLDKDPARRPGSAGGLADDLDTLAQAIAADPLGARSRSARRQQSAVAGAWPARTPAAASATASAKAPAAADTPMSEAASDEPTTPDALDRTPLPLRRDVHGSRSTGRSPEAARAMDSLRRDLARRRGIHSGPGAGESARGAGRRPSEPLQHRRAAPSRTSSTSTRATASTAASSRTTAPSVERTKRSSTSTGVRLGRLGQLSWPLVGLALLLLVLLVATLINSMVGAGSADARASISPSDHATSGVDDSGMMLHNASRGEPAATPMSKEA